MTLTEKGMYQLCDWRGSDNGSAQFELMDGVHGEKANWMMPGYIAERIYPLQTS